MGRSPSPWVGYYDMEFRDYVDDAWYSVRVVSEGKRLRVNFDNFPDEEDRVFDIDSEEDNNNDKNNDHNSNKKKKTLKNLQELEDFEERFRPLSQQLQDRDCSKVVTGIVVCASHSVDDSGLCFYDAVVDAVQHNEHSFADGEEECRCKFLVYWKHGPYTGNLMEKNVEDICLVQHSAVLDQALSSFCKLAREKIVGASCKSSSVTNSDISTCNDDKHQEASSPSIKRKLSFAQRMKQRTKCARRSVPSEGSNNLSEGIRQDRDVGGFRVCYTVLVENLEKDLSSSTIVEFIRKETGIAPEVYIFPSLSSESYARGAIMLDCEKNLDYVYGFLDDPNHIIISSKGRPWVVMEKISRHEINRVSIQTLMLKSRIKVFGYADELKVVHSGTEDYNKAKQLRDLFKCFADRKQRLNDRLVSGEREILQLS